MSTPDLIDALARNLAPIRRLRPPLWRATVWTFLASVVVALLAVTHGLRSDLAQRLAEPAYLVVLASSLGTGVLAAVASFFVSLPDRSWRWLLLPVPALLAWMGSIGYQCLTDWVSLAGSGIQAGETLRCFATLVLTGLPLSLALLLMLRHAALLHATAVGVMSGLAVGGFAATALWLLHELDASVMVVIWNVGTMMLALTIASVSARKLHASPRMPP